MPPPKLSNKVRKARHNAKLRRVLNPKNAITFLNELKPGGIKFVVKEEPGWGYSASVDVSDHKCLSKLYPISKTSYTDNILTVFYTAFILFIMELSC